MAKDMNREFLEMLQKKTEDARAELLETGRVDVGNGIVVTLGPVAMAHQQEVLENEWFRQFVRCVNSRSLIDFKEARVPEWAQIILRQENE